MNIKKSYPLVSLYNVSLHKTNKDRKVIPILNNINLDIYEGQNVALMGHSGSGKSTLLRLLAGIEKPTSGRVVYKGKDLHGSIPDVSLMLQDPALLPWLTILDNIKLALSRIRIDESIRYRKCLDIINAVGLGGFENYYPGEISGGMRQRASFARAMITNPQMIFLDEPFSSLDVFTRESLIDDLLSIFTEEKDQTRRSMIIVTHTLDEAVTLADKIVILDAKSCSIVGRFSVTFAYPRNLQEKEIIDFHNQIYYYLLSIDKKNTNNFALPRSDFALILGFLLEIEGWNEQHSLPIDEISEIGLNGLSESVNMVSTTLLFGWTMIKSGKIGITKKGRYLLEADMEDRGVLVASEMKRHIPLTNFVISCLVQNEYSLMIDILIDKIKANFGSCPDMKELLLFFEWATIAELFTYDKRQNHLLRL